MNDYARPALRARAPGRPRAIVTQHAELVHRALLAAELRSQDHLPESGVEAGLLALVLDAISRGQPASADEILSQAALDEHPALTARAAAVFAEHGYSGCAAGYLTKSFRFLSRHAEHPEVPVVLAWCSAAQFLLDGDDGGMLDEALTAMRGDQAQKIAIAAITARPGMPTETPMLGALRRVAAVAYCREQPRPQLGPVLSELERRQELNGFRSFVMALPAATSAEVIELLRAGTLICQARRDPDALADIARIVGSLSLPVGPQ